jgi:ribosomal protein S18 acetylase RimI-like enzyme
MQHPLVYRPANPADKPQLLQLGIDSYGMYKDQLSPEGWQIMHTVLHDAEKSGKLFDSSTCFVCTENETIIGMAYLVPSGHAWDVYKAEWAQLRMVGVHPAKQGRGIAKALTRMCIEHARNTGEKTLALHTSELMPAAMHIYEGLGFVKQFEMDRRFGKRYWLFTLEL